MNQLNAWVFLSILAMSPACKSETSDPSSARSSNAVSAANANHGGSPAPGSTGNGVSPASSDATKQAAPSVSPPAASPQVAPSPAGPAAATAPASPGASPQNCTPAVSVHSGQCDFDASWSDVASMCAALPGTIPASGCASQQLTKIQSSCCQAGAAAAATGSAASAQSQSSSSGGQGNLYWSVSCGNGSNYNHGPFATLQALCADMKNNASHCPAEFQVAYKAQGCS